MVYQGRSEEAKPEASSLGKHSYSLFQNLILEFIVQVAVLTESEAALLAIFPAQEISGQLRIPERLEPHPQA